MNERFYTPPIPASPAAQQRGSTFYRFRQPQVRFNPLALRRLQLQDVMSQRREETAAGQQELAAMKEMAHLEQQEYLIRQQITKERQVASAQREVAELNPETDPHYQQKYAEVMSRHPMAQDNKFLNEAFTEGSKINYRVAQHQFNTLEEGQKQAGREELAWIKASSAYAAMGGDPSSFTDKDGNHDWNALNAAHAKAVQATKAAADAASAGLPITKTVTKEGDTTVTREAPKAAKSELTMAQRINIAKMEGTLAGQTAQQQFWQKQMSDPNTKTADKPDIEKNLAAVTANIALTKGQVDAVHGVITPPVVPPSAPAAPATPSAAAPAATPAATPSAPAPAATPFDEMGKRMADIRTRQAELSQQKVDALNGMSKANPVFGGAEIDRHTAALDAANAEYQKLDSEWDDLSAKRMQTITPSSSTPPTAPATSTPATTPTPSRPPLSDLLPY